MFIMATQVTNNCSSSKNCTHHWRYALSPSNYYSTTSIKASPVTGPTLSPTECPGATVKPSQANNFGNKTSPCGRPFPDIKKCGTKSKGFRKARVVSKKTMAMKANTRLITVRAEVGDPGISGLFNTHANCSVEDDPGMSGLFNTHGNCSVEGDPGISGLFNTHGNCSVEGDPGISGLFNTHGNCSVEGDPGISGLFNTYGNCSKPEDGDDDDEFEYELDLVGPFPEDKNRPPKLIAGLILEKSKTNIENNLTRFGPNSSQCNNSLWSLICEASWGDISASDFHRLVTSATVPVIDPVANCEQAPVKTVSTYADNQQTRKRKSFVSDDTESHLPPPKRRRIGA